MARSLRIEFPGAVYHITSRGNEQREIFRSRRDREQFLGYLETASERYGAVVHAYGLMSNHYHLLLETPAGNLSEIMRHINGAYTTYFNVKRQRAGHLLQGRYKAILVEADAYATELSRYIHLNPVRARMVARPEDYAWTSYRSFLGQSHTPAWLKTGFVLANFGQEIAAAKSRYQTFVEDLLEKDYQNPLKHAVGAAILGSAGFVEKVRCQHLGEKVVDRNVPALRQLSDRPGPAEIIEAVHAVLGDQVKLARQMSIFLCHRHSGSKLRDIGELFGVRESAITEASRRFTLRLKADELIGAELSRVRKALEI